MNTETARQILTARFITEWEVNLPSFDYFIEGQVEPDFSSQSKPFGFFSLELPAISQIGVNGNVPPTRAQGLIEIGFFVRDGEGTKPFFDMTDAVQNMFGSQVVGGIRVTTITARKRVSATGWQARVLRVNYNFDSID